MKIQIVVFVGLIALCAALPQNLPSNVVPYSVILKSGNNLREDGYEFGFETSDPIVRNEVGIIQSISPDQLALRVNGNFAFNFPEGYSQQTVYGADENGYRAKVSFGQPIAPGQVKNVL